MFENQYQLQNTSIDIGIVIPYLGNWRNYCKMAVTNPYSIVSQSKVRLIKL